MAGRPKYLEFCARVEREGGDDVILDRIGAGEKVRDIAASYGLQSPRILYDWRNANPERKRAWMVAMADAKVDRAETILEEAAQKQGLTPTEARIAAELANHNRWTASKLNREMYGDTPQVQVNNLTIADLHLDALLKHARPDAIEGKVVEAEVLELEAGEDKA